MRVFILAMLMVLMASFASAAFAAGLDTANDKNLVLWLDFDTEEAEDLSPKKTVLSSVTPGTVVPGIIGDAWQFDEGSRLSIMGQSFSIPFTESTFSVWVLKSSNSGILFEEGGGTNGFCVHLQNGNLEYCTRDSGSATCIQAEFPVDDDEWHFVTAVFNGGSMELYIDGELVADQDGVPGIGTHANETGIGNVGLLRPAL